MKNESVNSCMEKISGNVTSEQEGRISVALAEAPEEKFGEVKSVKIKSLKHTTVLSAVLGLFGGGDFYLGFFKRAICKCIFNFILPIAILIVSFAYIVPVNRQYRDYDAHYLEFSECMTAELADFSYDYPFGGQSKASDSGQSEENKDSGVKSLKDGGFTANIVAAQQLYNSAYNNLESRLNDIKSNIDDKMKPVADEISENVLEERYSAINEAFAQFYANPVNEEVQELYTDYPNMTFAEYISAVDKIISDMYALFPDPAPSESEQAEKAFAVQLTESLNAVAAKLSNDDADANKEIIEEISDLAGRISVLADRSSLNRQYLEDFTSLDFTKFTPIDSLIQENNISRLNALAGSIAAMYDDYDVEDDFGDIAVMYYDIDYDYQNAKDIFDDFYEVYNTLIDVNSKTIYTAVDSKNKAITPDPKKDENGNTIAVKDFTSLMNVVLENIRPLTEDAEDESPVKTACELLEILAQRWGNSSLADDITAVYKERSAIEGEESESGKIEVNCLSGFENAFKNFVTTNFALQDKEGSEENESYPNLYSLKTVYDTLSAGLDGIRGDVDAISVLMEAFGNCAYFVSSNTAATMMHYYNDIDYGSHYYSEAEKAIMLTALLAETPSIGIENKLNITDTLSDYYFRAREIAYKFYQVGNKQTVNEILNSLTAMSNEITDLNARVKADKESRMFNVDYTSMFVGIMVGIDAVIIICYWIGEVFRNREKCMNINCEAVLSAVKDKVEEI